MIKVIHIIHMIVHVHYPMCVITADSSDLKEVSIDLEEDEVDLRCYRPAGGVILLDLYTLPPQSKTIQDWTLKQGTYMLLLCLIICNNHFCFVMLQL